MHCGAGIGNVDTSRDHVPSKCFLTAPYPSELPVVEICHACNNGFSRDEEYAIAFLGAVLSGSTDPEKQTLAQSASVLRRTPKLRQRIEDSRTAGSTSTGEALVLWKPEQERIDRVLIKNARGHAYFEFGEPVLSTPDWHWSRPLHGLEQRAEFQRVELSAAWPEVGSRMLTRVVTGDDLSNGWVIVQPGVYRYAVFQDGGLVVRIMPSCCRLRR